MLKNILKMEGAQKLTSKEKNSIIGAGKNWPVCFYQCGESGGVPDNRFPGQCICY